MNIITKKINQYSVKAIAGIELLIGIVIAFTLGVGVLQSKILTLKKSYKSVSPYNDKYVALDRFK